MNKKLDIYWNTAVKNCDANDMESIIKTFFKIAKENGENEKECREHAYEIVEANVIFLRTHGRTREALNLALIGMKIL